MSADFITLIAPIIQEEAARRGYKYPSAIIAQACLESNYGKSKLASKYHNYFGLKCGSKWRGRSVSLKTNEEYSPGTLTRITDNFRVYDTMEAGVAGYFDFISAARYSNLKQAESSRDYLEKIKRDGYATSVNYVKNVYRVVTLFNLLRYDNTVPAETVSDKFIKETAQKVIAGEYGTGAARKNIIGKYYDDIQKEVNRILKGG